MGCHASILRTCIERGGPKLTEAEHKVRRTKNKSADDPGGVISELIDRIVSRVGLGLGMGEIQNVIRELMGYCRENGAADALGDIAASIPGLSQYI